MPKASAESTAAEAEVAAEMAASLPIDIRPRREGAELGRTECRG